MTSKRCLNIGLALMLGLSLAMTNLKAEDPAANDVPAEAVPVKDVYVGQTDQEMVFVSALNEYRAARGLHSVGVSSELSSACRSWSSHMRQRGHLSHDPTGGMEICAQISSESGINALQAWQRSPAHNAILLSSRMDTIGIGSDGIWWTMRGIQTNSEYTVFRPTTNIRMEAAAAVAVEDDTIGRVPMSVSRYSVQRVAADVPVRVPSSAPAADANAEDTIGRVPIGVAASSYSARTVPNHRYRR